MADAEVTQLNTLAVSLAAVERAETSQLNAMVVAAFPSEFSEASQVQSNVVVEADVTAQVSLLDVLVVAMGRIASPRLSAWTFPLDNHNFYVLNLGRRETLVFDKYTGTWAVWGDGTDSKWRLSCGTTWHGAGINSSIYGSNIIAGDDTLGTLYFLDPEYPYDDSAFATEGAPAVGTFQRTIQGQIINRGRVPAPCYGVQLTGSFGTAYDPSLTSVTLQYSDDAGRSYFSAGTLTVPPGDYAARVEWLSMGMIRTPGRLFKLTDDGALARVDGFESLGGEQ